LRQRAISGQRGAERGARFFQRTSAFPSGPDAREEDLELGAVGRLEAVPEVSIGGARASGERRALVEPGNEAVLRAEHFEAHVVAQRIVPGSRQDDEAAARKAQ